MPHRVAGAAKIRPAIVVVTMVSRKRLPWSATLALWDAEYSQPDALASIHKGRDCLVDSAIRCWLELKG